MKKLTPERKLQIIEKTANAVSIVCFLSSAGLIGYYVGRLHEGHILSKGMDLMWKHDPTLKDHCWNTLNDYVKSHKN